MLKGDRRKTGEILINKNAFFLWLKILKYIHYIRKLSCGPRWVRQSYFYEPLPYDCLVFLPLLSQGQYYFAKYLPTPPVFPI